MAGSPHASVQDRIRRHPAPPAACWLVLACLSLLHADPAAAAVSLTVDVGHIQGAGWEARGVSVRLEQRESGGWAGTLIAETLSLPGPMGRIKNASLRCGRLHYAPAHIRCDSARVDPGDLPFGLTSLQGSIDYRAGDGLLELYLTGEDGAGGRLRLTGRAADASWSMKLAADALDLAAWAGLIDFADAADAEADAGQGELSGRLDLTLEASGQGTVAQGAFEGRIRELSGYNASGTTAVEGLQLAFTGHLEADAGQTRFETRLSLPSGELYQEPVYADLGVHPVTIELQGQATPGVIELPSIRIRQDRVLDGLGSASLRHDGEAGWGVAAAGLTLDRLLLPGAYDVLLQPFLAGTDLANLETAGSLWGELRIVDDTLDSATLEIRDVYMDDRDGRLAVYGLNASLVRGREGGGRPMSIRWDGGFVYGISYGAALLDFESRPGGWTLARPVAIPVLDGALEIDVLELGVTGEDETSMAFDARLTPIDMRWLSRALDWPPLSGTLSGRIPSLSYENGEIALAGTLEARMFDGLVAVSELRVREPFSERAVLRANIDIERLDLRLVTEAFAFGLITGRLDGYIHDLIMFGWSPVAFDARLYTSRGGKSGRRISQRAVDNIASLGGGGGAAALSSGFLRFFDDFAYDTISLGCRLDRDVCAMSGIEPAGTGYLILRGRGLPQINVVGFSRQVSWPTMVGQLKSIMESQGPVID